MQNTVLAGNSADTIRGHGGPNCHGLLTSQGHNFFGDLADCDVTPLPTDLTGDPRLGEFTDGGIPGRGHVPLLPASRAVQTGNDAVCPETDQLGQPRVGICDIGAVEFPRAIVVVNASVTFDPLRLTFQFTTDPTGCPEAFAGRFSFDARLTNTSAHPLSDLFAEVTTLTHGNLLQNADGGPAGVGAWLSVPTEEGFSDGVLRSDAFVDVSFVICLQQRRPFRFMVNVEGSLAHHEGTDARVGWQP